MLKTALVWKVYSASLAIFIQNSVIFGLDDRKSVTLGQTGAATANLTLEVDITGSGLWMPYQTFAVAEGKTVEHTFDPAFSAYWIRARTDAACAATVWLTYE